MNTVSWRATGIPGEVVVGGAAGRGGAVSMRGAPPDHSGAGTQDDDEEHSHEYNVGRAVSVVVVANFGDRPVQVGSHFHFAETNAALKFDRDAAWGKRLGIPAGTSVRFEPGIERSVNLVALAGRRFVAGLRGLVGGLLDPPPENEQSSSDAPMGISPDGAIGDRDANARTGDA